MPVDTWFTTAERWFETNVVDATELATFGFVMLCVLLVALVVLMFSLLRPGPGLRAMTSRPDTACLSPARLAKARVAHGNGCSRRSIPTSPNSISVHP